MGLTAPIEDNNADSGLSGPMQRDDRPSSATLETLRARIAAIERRPPLAQSQSHSLAGAEAPIDLLDCPPGLLHEIHADDHRQSGAVLGFALGLARRQLGAGKRAIFYLQLAGDAQELGLPYGLGLSRFGLAPDTLVICRPQTPVELLWALEEAIACRAVAGVVADIAGNPKLLDFTASRRLSLRAAASGTSAFLIRYGPGREASAAQLRWRVTPALSAGDRWDPAAPGLARLAVDIEKRRLGTLQQRAEQTRLMLDWTENGFVVVEPGRRSGDRPQRAAPPRALPAALGDGLSQAS